MPKTIGYVRVSTDEQDYRNQKYEILNYCDKEHTTVDTWIELEVSTRRSLKERAIEELLSSLRAGDRLIVTELSRLGRSTSEVIQLVKKLAALKVEFISVKQGLKINSSNDNDMASKIMVTIFSLLAELERDLLSQRTKTALQRAKADGKKLGRPRGPGKSRLDGKEGEIRGLLNKRVTKANIAKILDVSWGTVDNFIKRRMV
ncbi:MAG: recombinase family protein [Nitrospirae bacterium]|nr:recombinase family protein [Nitrospirota bacterium]MBF0618431.1 recombinase family protein [Nitrospirota bacterium]